MKDRKWIKFNQKIGKFFFISYLCFIPRYSFGYFEKFTGCTFYEPRLSTESFANGSDLAGCAQFSAVNGRNGCTKTKLFVHYRGDDIQMWLPDYFIEVTKHIGRSVFAESLDGKILELQLQLAVKWWEANTASVANPLFSDGSQSTSSRDSFWHARILTVPYGSIVNNYPPLSAGKGGPPSCFSAISEFFPAQWDMNLSDGPYAMAWAPVGSVMCLSTAGGLSAAAIAEAKKNAGTVANGAGQFPSNPVQCANPVGAKEGFAKNALPSSDAISPIGDISRLCMGTWGNLVPRTGWIQSEDPKMSALMAAYKFASLAGDFHLNGDLKPRADDKWQIVYPPQFGGSCFTPGNPFTMIPPPTDDPFSRGSDELTPGSSLKNSTYIIAVWKKRESCEEPLQFINGWSADYKANFVKNSAICQGMRSP